MRPMLPGNTITRYQTNEGTFRGEKSSHVAKFKANTQSLIADADIRHPTTTFPRNRHPISMFGNNIVPV